MNRLTIYLAMAFLVTALILYSSVRAEAEQDVEFCEPVAKTKTFTIERCEDPDMGNIFYVNSLGFMFPWE